MTDRAIHHIGGVVKGKEPTLTWAEQKIWDYLKEHKTPVMAGTLAKRFIISQSKTSQALAMLERHGLAESFSVGRSKFYKMRRGDE